ncbi:hypothetical protein H2204_002055 [Knufia peltigerae]|uniref:Carboxylic ester hydrolase n=1 Tax=Knufia peltigerae TaxID=1002370 RepID=A0AA38YBL7_9EURO|nr:hypothetical protein H2204_002055 [Knufia peltigerae]
MAGIDGDTIVRLPGGRVQGFLTDDGEVFRARGVRYATAERFRESRLVDRWDDVWDCTKPAVLSPQLPSRLAVVVGDIQGTRPQSEDCLHVSIAAPASAVGSAGKSTRGALPVMVFFHGGAYVSGGGDLDCYDGTPLARRGVVVVNVTYRLGVLGYYPVGDDGVASPNLGLSDQITALKWVQTNIACFGGDAGNVTLFGQSAGGDSIFSMLLLDETQDLFHRAILQSAPFGERTKPFAERQKMEKRMGEAMIESLAGQNIKDIPFEEVLKTPQVKAAMAAKEFPTGVMPFAPSFYRRPYEGTITQAMSSLDDVSRIRKPVLISYTRDDGAIFARMDGWLGPLLKTPLLGRVALSFKEWLYTGQIFGWGSEKMYSKISDAGGNAALVYFSHRFQYGLGAAHCICLPYLLGSWSAWERAPMLQGPNAKDIVARVGPEVRKLWVAFASGSNLQGKRFEINDSFRFE